MDRLREGATARDALVDLRCAPRPDLPLLLLLKLPRFGGTRAPVSVAPYAGSGCSQCISACADLGSLFNGLEPTLPGRCSGDSFAGPCASCTCLERPPSPECLPPPYSQPGTSPLLAEVATAPVVSPSSCACFTRALTTEAFASRCKCAGMRVVVYCGSLTTPRVACSKPVCACSDMDLAAKLNLSCVADSCYKTPGAGGIQLSPSSCP